MVPPNWKRFFMLRVPLSLALIVMLFQGIAFALERIPLRRSYMDDLALAVERDHTPHRVVLLGDSITMNSTRRFELGRSAGDVVNLATIAWTGAAAELFLLERYLAGHPPPQYVIYAAAIDDLNTNDGPQLVHYYDWNVYTLPSERDFMRRYIPGIDARERLPAVLDFQENIVERLTSLLRRGAPSMPEAEREPDPDVRTEPPSDNRMSAAVQTQRIEKKLILGSLQKAVFTRICRLSKEYGFQFRVVWPPIPPTVLKAWRERGEFDPINAELQAVLDHDCNAGPTFDVNGIRPYTNFNRDGFHLHGEAWEQRYAADLSQYIASLPERANTAAARSDIGGDRAASMLAR